MINDLAALIKKTESVSHISKIENVVGLSMEASGGNARIGDIAYIYNEADDHQIPVEVVGFKNGKIQLMAYENITGIAAGTFVRNTGKRLSIPVSKELVGRIIDSMGQPIDNKGPIKADAYYEVNNVQGTNPLDRPRIEDRLEFGVRAIDSLLTIGKGQRVGIFAGSGVGKSTTMGMIARNVKADINVIALVGERGRELLEFVEHDLGPEGMKRSVIVVATSDQPAMLRVKCPLVATTVAEYFRDQGLDVLLMMDSLTRFAMAQRDIGLATGEPPVARGYTPSIYAEFPKLLERAGKFTKGSITGVYTVLVEGDDVNEPISDTARSILDGHIVLSRRLANENHYPAIDVSASISRLMSNIAEPEHKKVAAKFRDYLSIYEKNADLIAIGAYKKGSNPALDVAISKIDAMNSFLKQTVDEKSTMQGAVEQMREIVM